MGRLITRRKLMTGVALTAPFIISGCDRLTDAPAFRNLVLRQGERLSSRAQRFLGRDALAPEFTEAELSPFFRTNGTRRPDTEEYDQHESEGFANWRVRFGGLVNNPIEVSMADLRALPSRTQITRHDCVEGWSAIGKWKGAQLGQLLDAAQLQPDARFIVFRCADSLRRGPYYESIDLVDAFHPQTLLAYELNDEALPIGNGAPVRLRVERQLGYKQAKYITGIDAVASFDDIEGGGGGYWPDSGYDWYAGI